MGASPLHASTVGLVRNLRTQHISPQFHVVYDDLFETVHAGTDTPPASWPDLFTFHRFKSDYDDEDFVPALADEWLTPIELSQRQLQEQAHRSQDGAPTDDIIAPGPTDEDPAPPMPPPPDSTVPQRAPPGSDAPQRAPPSSDPDGPQRAPPPSPPPPDPIVPQRAQPETSLEGPEPPTPVRRNPRRTRQVPERYRVQHGFSVVKSYCRAMVGALLLTQGQAYDSRYLLNLLLDNEFGLYENLAPDTLMLSPHGMKASSAVDPDTPRLHEAMRGDHRDDFLTAMGEEISALEAHGTWNIVRRDSMPAGSNLLPGTWALKIKRYPDGRMRKHKARYCVRGRG
jgi:hypothetical protein